MHITPASSSRSPGMPSPHISSPPHLCGLHSTVVYSSASAAPTSTPLLCPPLPLPPVPHFHTSTPVWVAQHRGLQLREHRADLRLGVERRSAMVQVGTPVQPCQLSRAHIVDPPQPGPWMGSATRAAGPQARPKGARL
eukprot:366247-Chlamydomonas_euryale.AAC.7